MVLLGSFLTHILAKSPEDLLLSPWFLLLQAVQLLLDVILHLASLLSGLPLVCLSLVRFEGLFERRTVTVQIQVSVDEHVERSI